MSEIIKYLQKLSSKDNLTNDEIKRAWQITQLGGATPAQIAAFISCLSMKPPSFNEIHSTAEYFQNKLIKNPRIKFQNNCFSIQANYTESFNLKIVLLLVSLLFAAKNVKTICFYDKKLFDLLSDFRIFPSGELNEICLDEANIIFCQSSKFDYLTKDTIQILNELRIDNIFNITKPLIYTTNSQIIKIKDETDIDFYRQFYKDCNKKIWLIYNDNTEKLFDSANRVLSINNSQISEFDLIDKDISNHDDFNFEEITWNDLNKFISGEETKICNYIINNMVLSMSLFTSNRDFSAIKLEIKDIVKQKSIRNIIKQLVNITSEVQIIDQF